MTTHIVAMGGGGFSSSEGFAATALDRYILSLTDASDPLVCFIPTAAADHPLYIQRFIKAYTGANSRARISILTLWEGVPETLNILDQADVIYVGGGSTVNLLAVWNAHGVNRKIIEIASDPDREVVIGGLAAGGSAMHEACTTGSFGRGIEPYPHGLALVPGSFSPHYDRTPDRAPKYQAWVDDGTLPPGYGVEIGAAVHYIDGEIEAFLTERDGAKAYWVDQAEQGAMVEAQEMTLL